MLERRRAARSLHQPKGAHDIPQRAYKVSKADKGKTVVAKTLVPHEGVIHPYFNEVIRSLPDKAGNWKYIGQGIVRKTDPYWKYIIQGYERRYPSLYEGGAEDAFTKQYRGNLVYLNEEKRIGR